MTRRRPRKDFEPLPIWIYPTFAGEHIGPELHIGDSAFVPVETVDVSDGVVWVKNICFEQPQHVPPEIWLDYAIEKKYREKVSEEAERKRKWEEGRPERERVMRERREKEERERLARAERKRQREAMPLYRLVKAEQKARRPAIVAENRRRRTLAEEYWAAERAAAQARHDAWAEEQRMNRIARENRLIEILERWSLE